MKNTISQFTQKCYSDISENIITKFIDSLEESIDQLIETKCIDAATDHEELSVAIHNLADSVLTDFTFQDYCLLASHFINENNPWNIIPIGLSPDRFHLCLDTTGGT